MSRTYLHLGSNQDNRKANLDQALKLLMLRVGKLTSKSNIYETEPWGVKGQDDFLNQAICMETALKPKALLAEIRKIENEIGTNKTEQWGSRRIDIDILFYDEKQIIEPDLIIPHIRLPERNFVLIPLMEIAGEFVHPKLGKTIEEIYEECSDPCEVWIYSN